MLSNLVFWSKFSGKSSFGVSMFHTGAGDVPNVCAREMRMETAGKLTDGLV